MDTRLELNGEYYVSLVYKLMVQDLLRVRIFEIEKMLQWGTPNDLEIYKTWSSYFKNRKEIPLSFRGTEDTTLLLPMAGAGSRFQMQGYTLPKPLLPVNGLPMVIQAVASLPPSKQTVFVCLEDHLNSYSLEKTLKASSPGANVLPIAKVTEGQACTCEIALNLMNIQDSQSILVSACDNGAYYDVQDYYKLVDDVSNAFSETPR